jgi:hypothetical protein
MVVKIKANGDSLEVVFRLTYVIMLAILACL